MDGHSMRMLLRYLLAHPDDEHLMNRIIDDVPIPRGTIGGLVHRLASIGWVEWVRASDPQTRPFRLTADGAAGAKASLKRPGTPERGRRVKAWTMTELRAAVARGEQPEGLLWAAEAALGLKPGPEEPGGTPG